MPLTHRVQFRGQSDVINSEPEPDYQLEVQTSFFWATEKNQVNWNSNTPTRTACCVVESV